MGLSLPRPGAGSSAAAQHRGGPPCPSAGLTASSRSVVCVGGDGMFSEVLHGLIGKTQRSAGIDQDQPWAALVPVTLRIGIIPAGRLSHGLSCSSLQHGGAGGGGVCLGQQVPVGGVLKEMTQQVQGSGMGVGVQRTDADARAGLRWLPRRHQPLSCGAPGLDLAARSPVHSAGKGQLLPPSLP